MLSKTTVGDFDLDPSDHYGLQNPISCSHKVQPIKLTTESRYMTETIQNNASKSTVQEFNSLTAVICHLLSMKIKLVSGKQNIFFCSIILYYKQD